MIVFTHAVPAPISPLTFRRSHNTALSAGTAFSLTCIIIPNTTGVDTDIIVESSIVGNGILDADRVSAVSQPVSVGENTFETTVTFNYLLEADAGAYNCSAYIMSSSLPNVIASDPISSSETISIGGTCIYYKLKEWYSAQVDISDTIINPLYSVALQAPTISVFPFQGISVEAGGQDTITCTATFDEGLVQRPTLVWEFPGSTADTTMGDQLENRGTTTKTLTFNDIHKSQAGVYTCRAAIDLQGLDSQNWTASLVIQVQS